MMGNPNPNPYPFGAPRLVLYIYISCEDRGDENLQKECEIS